MDLVVVIVDGVVCLFVFLLVVCVIYALTRILERLQNINEALKKHNVSDCHPH